MVGWYHQLNGHELGLTLGDDEEQGVHRVTESDMTQRLNNNKVNTEKVSLSNISSVSQNNFLIKYDTAQLL